MHSKPCWTPDCTIAAYRFAAEAHRGQTVPGTNGQPYLMHLSLVTMEVMACLHIEPFDDPDLAVMCALLHDTLEDTACTYDQLADAFGPAVARGVQALTKDPTLPKSARMDDSLQRIRAQPREVWIVKLADRITNLQAPPREWARDKRERYRDEAGRILAQLGDASPYLASRLTDKIAAYQAYIDTSATIRQG